MSYNKVRFAAGVLTVTLAFTGTGISAKAVSLSSSLPVAGIGLSLEEGVSLKTVEHHGDYSREIVEPISFPAPVVKDVPVEEDYSNLVIARVDSYVNVRSIPGEDGEIVGKLYDKSVGNFLEEENGWYKIQSGNCTGYVKAEYCVTGEEANALAKEVGRRIATVTTETLNVRKEATTDSSILGQVPIEGSYGNGRTGWLGTG